MSVMDRQTRNRLEILERVVREVEAREERAMADLRRAGFTFGSFAEAERYLKSERTRVRRIAESMFQPSERQIEVAIAALENREAQQGRKKKAA